jgi:hypothetical protein
MACELFGKASGGVLGLGKAAFEMCFGPTIGLFGWALPRAGLIGCPMWLSAAGGGKVACCLKAGGGKVGLIAGSIPDALEEEGS